ncbi:MAG: hypothetical protein ACOCXX_00725 [Planctomycetota bacterium]
MSDPIIKELWDIKDGLARECGDDLRRLFDRLKQAQESMDVPTVNRTNRDSTTRTESRSS